MLSALARALRSSVATSCGKLVLLAVIAAALAWGTFGIQTLAIERLLRQDAVSAGHRWADYLARHVGDLGAIAEGRRPSAQSMEFFERAQSVGNVFRYKIFSPAGRLRLISDELNAIGTDTQNLAEHNVAAAQAIAAGRPLVTAKVGQPPGRPPFFSEAYVPVIVEGRTIAIVETYVDQSEQREHFRSVFWSVAAGLSLLVALAFGIPAAAWQLSMRARQRAEAHVHHLAFHDLLTGLANRNRLVEDAQERLGASAAGGRMLALHHIDIDNFKAVKDAHGHGVGDLLINVAAERLKAVAGAGDVVARLVGDEFALLQGDVASAGEAEARARQIVAAMVMPFSVDAHEIAVSASVGFAVAPEDGETVSQLLRNAELALYNSRARGGNCALGFAADMEAALQSRLTLEKTIREAVLSKSFDLHFQPIFGALDGDLVGFEALLRLKGPDGAFIPPDVFIPLAEQMGLIGRVGRWVLGEACRQAATWPDHLTVAVNLSALQFSDGSVCEVVAAALEACGLDPCRLELEITESVLLEDTDAVLAELAQLKALGSAIVMDDFGTGYSSLNYLWRFPFDEIKIDRSFMRGFDAEEKHAATVVESAVVLARSLKLRVTLEGVENLKQLEFARRVNCHYVQGFYCGRPMPAAEIASYMLGRGAQPGGAEHAA